MTMLKDRLRLAMDGPPRVTQRALATACGASFPTVNDWLSGKSQTMRSQYLAAAARFLGVSAEWLATGKGAMRPETNSETELAQPSQPAGLDRAILHEALTLLFYDEMHAGDYTPHARTDRLAELYGWVATDGGRLTKERNAAFVQEVSERHQEAAGGSNGAIDSGKRPKGRAGTSRH